MLSLLAFPEVLSGTIVIVVEVAVNVENVAVWLCVTDVVDSVAVVDVTLAVVDEEAVTLVEVSVLVVVETVDVRVLVAVRDVRIALLEVVVAVLVYVWFVQTGTGKFKEQVISTTSVSHSFLMTA